MPKDSAEDFARAVTSSCRMLRSKLQKIIPFIRSQVISRKVNQQNELDELELQAQRYKPQGLDALCECTKFTRKELQLMYRGFKQECPSGIVNEETFKSIYAHFFPQGDPSLYAHYVFNAFDSDRSGTISFEEFVLGLSVVARGNLHEKLEWAFTLYDTNGDGVITRGEMYDVIHSIYCMMGRHTDPPTNEQTTQEHVERIFKKMDLDNDGYITCDDFMDACLQDDDIVKAIVMFDTVM